MLARAVEDLPSFGHPRVPGGNNALYIHTDCHDPSFAREMYEAWLDSLGHSEMTHGEANVSGEVGAEVSAWDALN